MRPRALSRAPMLPDRLRRRCSALLLGVFGLAWALDAHHRAWVPHVVCAVDGEVAHGAHGSHEPREPESHGPHEHPGPHEHHGPQAPEGEDDCAPRVAAPTAGEEHHEHCGLPDLGRSSGLDSSVAERVGPPPATALRDHVTPWADAHESVPRVSLAPKQSPPRAV